MGEFKGEISSIQITEDVISSIAAAAALDTEGVAGLEIDSDNGFLGLFFRKNIINGVEIELKGSEVSLGLGVLVYFGCKLNEIGVQIQKNVKEAVENMAGLKVKKINISIVGIEKKEAAPEVSEKEADNLPEEDTVIN